MDQAVLDDALARLRVRGVPFAYLHGSQADGSASATSDIDIAALFPDPAPASFEVELPRGVDLLALNGAPLEIAGRIALHGQLILEDDPAARVRWEARTRKIYLDEKYRIDRSHQEFLEAASAVDGIRVLRLLRPASDALESLASEQDADAVRRADPLWLPGVKYLMIAMVESCIDVAQHICSAEKWGTPRDNGEAMRMLGSRGVITTSTAESMRLAVGFRNVLVHEYVDVDDAIVTQRLADLSDVEGFIGEVGAWLPRG